MVPDCSPPKIFVSYAHVDNKQLVGVQQGWVSTFIENLKTNLAGILGREDAFELWRDNELPGNVPVTEEIQGKVRDADILLLILSPGYLASDWCRQEMELFQQQVQAGTRPNSRMFVVEYAKVGRPRELDDFTGYRFYTEGPLGTKPLGYPQPLPEDRPYYDSILYLCNSIVAELKRPKDKEKLTVFLAETTDDVRKQREDVKSFLQQQGLRIVPEFTYSRDAAEYRKAAEADLRGAKLFVQILGRSPGKELRGSIKSFVALQYKVATEIDADIKIEQWHDTDIVPADRKDKAYRKLLLGKTVTVSRIGGFKAQLARRVKELTTTKPAGLMERLKADQDNLVFIDAQEYQIEFAKKIGDLLFDRGIGHVIPPTEVDPKQFRSDIEEFFLNCDALMLLYGTNRAWVVRQWGMLIKMKPRRTKVLKAAVLCDGPPPEKTPFHFKFPNLEVIDCRNGVCKESFQSFIESCRVPYHGARSSPQ